MEEFSITWSGKIYGNIKIREKSSKKAKEKLRSMTKIDLVGNSGIWQNDDCIKIECVDTYLGTLDEKTWDMIFDDHNKSWILVEKT